MLAPAASGPWGPSGALASVHPRVGEGEIVEHGLVHAVDQGAVCARQSGLLVDELLVEVAAVAWR